MFLYVPLCTSKFKLKNMIVIKTPVSSANTANILTNIAVTWRSMYFKIINSTWSKSEEANQCSFKAIRKPKVTSQSDNWANSDHRILLKNFWIQIVKWNRDEYFSARVWTYCSCIKVNAANIHSGFKILFFKSCEDARRFQVIPWNH